MRRRQMDEVWYYGCAPSRTPELKPCPEMHEATLGVGDGSGQLFVHGSYEAIKRVQKMIFELERATDPDKRLREALEAARHYIANCWIDPVAAEEEHALVAKIDAALSHNGG